MIGVEINSDFELFWWNRRDKINVGSRENEEWNWRE